MLAVPLDEASAKVSTGLPEDADEDRALGFWAGVVPVSLTFGTPAPDVGVEGPPPDYLVDYSRSG